MHRIQHGQLLVVRRTYYTESLQIYSTSILWAQYEILNMGGTLRLLRGVASSRWSDRDTTFRVNLAWLLVLHLLAGIRLAKAFRTTRALDFVAIDGEVV